jgi:hypothetical protein
MEYSLSSIKQQLADRIEGRLILGRRVFKLHGVELDWVIEALRAQRDHDPS